MLDLQCGDRIELLYEDASATLIRATVGRLLTDREEGMGVEIEDYTACWIEITVDEPCDMDANQVVLLGMDFRYRLNGRCVTLRKGQTQDERRAMVKPSVAREISAVDKVSRAESVAKEFPAPKEGFIVTHLLIISDQDRSRDFYSRVLGGQVIRERDPAVVRLSNTWLILNTGGGPTDDKPEVIAAPPESSHVLTSGLNIRVADVWAIYREWSARGAQFLTEPKDHLHEIRCYIRDPDGHLIEVGQSIGILTEG
jgi:catechol 2,3-dioxygenase-like lactoylglutathione lyase family enzyme